jgi:anti-sigma regulatory factor (Ser/Thr protein kinase)
MEPQVVMQEWAPRPLSRSGPGRMAVWSLPADSAHRAERRARALLRSSLQRAGVACDDVLDAETAVAELAVNAVQHATPPYELRVFYVGGSLPIWCEVVDGGPVTDVFSEHLRLPEDMGLSERGRGLRMVEGLSDGRCATYPSSLSRTGIPAKAVGFALPFRRRNAR